MLIVCIANGTAFYNNTEYNKTLIGTRFGMCVVSPLMPHHIMYTQTTPTYTKTTPIYTLHTSLKHLSMVRSLKLPGCIWQPKDSTIFLNPLRNCTHKNKWYLKSTCWAFTLIVMQEHCCASYDMISSGGSRKWKRTVQILTKRLLFEFGGSMFRIIPA